MARPNGHQAPSERHAGCFKEPLQETDCEMELIKVTALLVSCKGADSDWFVVRCCLQCQNSESYNRDRQARLAHRTECTRGYTREGSRLGASSSLHVSTVGAAQSTESYSDGTLLPCMAARLRVRKHSVLINCLTMLYLEPLTVTRHQQSAFSYLIVLPLQGLGKLQQSLEQYPTGPDIVPRPVVS